MTVYIELILFNNIAIDFLLFVCVQICRKRKIRKLRTLLACIVCGVVATYYAVAPNSAQIAIKILLAPLATLLFDKYASQIECGHINGEQGNFSRAIDVQCNGGQSDKEQCNIGRSVDKRYKRISTWGKDYCKSLALFVAFTYLTGGVVFGLSYLLSIDIASYATLGLCALAISVALVVARCVVHKASTAKKRDCEVVLHLGNTEIHVHALCDSGNTLTDSVSGLPIMILSKETESRLPNCKIEGFVNVDTVSGEKSLPLVSIDRVDVDGRLYSAYGALSHKDFDGVDVILQYSMF